MKNSNKPHGLNISRKVGQSITLAEINLIIHVAQIGKGRVKLVFENQTEKITPVYRTEILNEEFSGPSSL
jgi:sRNA-binding carbon storage regulator CsrA